MVLLHIDLSNILNDAGDSGFREESISPSVTWDTLKRKIQHIAGRDDIAISYYDEDGDIIIIGSDDELQEAVKVASRMDDLLPLLVTSVHGGPYKNEKMVIELNVLERRPSASEHEIPKRHAESKSKADERKKQKCKISDDCKAAKREKKCYKKMKACNDRKYCHPETGEAAARCPAGDGKAEPPGWFLDYMNKFRKEMATEFPKQKAKDRIRMCVGEENATEGELTKHGNGDIHEGVFCNQCLKLIVGIRYKCGNCVDFDLCEACEELGGSHDERHIFMKIRNPLPKRKKAGWRVPLLKKNLYQTRAKRAWKRCDSVPTDAEERATPAAVETGDFEFGAAFIRDDTIPDGTHVQPKTRFTKRWVVKNIGQLTWTDDVRLELLGGEIEPLAASVPVPSLAPEDVACVSVELIAPAEPGNYDSTWTMAKNGFQFGHQMWCSIVVDAKEVLEPTMLDSCGDVCPTVYRGNAEEEEPLLAAMSQSDDMLNARDEEAASDDGNGGDDDDDDDDVVGEVLLTEYCTLTTNAKVSHTATPSNTPLDFSPPMTPVPHLEECIRSLSLGDDDEKRIFSMVDTSDMTESATAEARGDEFLEFADCHDGSDESSDNSDDDFFVVPIPDCFRTDLPSSMSASTNVVVRRADKNKLSGSVSSVSLEESSLKQKAGEGISAANIIEDKVLQTMEPVAVAANTMASIANGNESQSNSEGAPCENVEQEVYENNRETDATPDTSAENGPQGESTTEASQELIDSAVSAGATATEMDEVVNPLADLGELAWNGARIVGAAAVSVAKTAKSIYHHMQAQNQYVPPVSTWTPPTTAWTPAAREWTPPQDNYTPPASTWTPPKQQWVPPAMWNASVKEWSPPLQDTNDPHKLLLDMGFANREQNQRLLQKHNNDVDAVISELIAESDNEWSARRY